MVGQSSATGLVVPSSSTIRGCGGRVLRFHSFFASLWTLESNTVHCISAFWRYHCPWLGVKGVWSEEASGALLRYCFLAQLSVDEAGGQGYPRRRCQSPNDDIIPSILRYCGFPAVCPACRPDTCRLTVD